ncbi:ribonuclease H-like domain-containing protein [Mycena olivaceomarginata]|nr:ribonuclease H-like domain-containing protein [Mycena olivaceomarginata]
MSSHYIRAQVLVLTKSHEERIGPLKAVANSLKTYGHDDPMAIFSDDPVKKLTPIATAHGLQPLELPKSLQVKSLDTPQQLEGICSSLMALLDGDPKAHLSLSLDAEWNISRKVGVSVVQIAPHPTPDSIFIIPVHKFKPLPLSFLRLLISNRVFKIGVGVKGDLTRLKKQFTQLANQGSFNIIDLKEYAIQRGIIGRQDSGALDVLVEKILGKYLVKDDASRRSEDWELKTLRPDMQTYAALDVLASRLIFEEASKIFPIDNITIDSPAGTRVALLVQDGGVISAYGKIAVVQPPSFAGIRVYTPNRNRILVDVDTVLIPPAAALFHQLSTSSKTKRTAAGAYTLGQLQSASSSFS